MKYIIRVQACFCIVVLLLSGCRSVGKTPDLKTVLSEVGRTFSDLRQQYPTYEYLHLGGCDCSLECLGEPGGKSALVFFGTQAGPGLDEVAPSRQTELKCVGIYTSLGQVFTLSEDKTVEDLLKSLNINLAEVTDWNGWLLTDYQGYRMIINTEYENADKTEIISALADPNWVLVITDETVIANNEKLLE